jgi:hypothetical protein
MFSRSTWFLSLCALLGVFFSPPSSAQGYYGATICNQTYYDSTQSGAIAKAIARIGCFSDFEYLISVNPDNDEVIYQANWGQSVGRLAVFYSDSSCTNSSCTDPVPNLDYRCDDSEVFDIPSLTCGIPEPLGDTDGDGLENVLDDDSTLYDPNYCSDNPNVSICSGAGDSGGDDSGGGDSGGGSGGSGTGGGSGSWSPPTGSECTTQADSQTCCTDYGQFYCQDKGGLSVANWTDIGGLSCSVTCNDDITDPPPTDGGGDSGGDTSGDTSSSFDDSDIISAINNSSNQNSNDLNSVQSAITDGFSDLDTRIVDLNNNLATGINGVGSELNTLNNTANYIRSNTAETTSAVNALDNNLSGIFDVDGDAIEPAFSSGGFVDGDMDGDAYMVGFGDSTGIDTEAQLETETVNLGDTIDQFDPMLGGSSTECPAPYVLSIAGTDVEIDFTAVCDAFGILSIFVQAAAWFATPFIILGVSKG